MKKNIQRKKDRKLRQSIEILKAQLSIDTEAKSKVTSKPTKIAGESKIMSIDDTVVKRDLIKTLVLSAVGFSTILLLWAFDITGFNF